MKKTKVLIEGHDLKFMPHIINHFKAKPSYSVEVFTYPGHVISDTTHIDKVLAGFDIIFCEWGLGNLSWFSRAKLPGQKLISRIHSQEFYTSYLSEVEWEKVDAIIFVSQHILKQFSAIFPGLSEKCQVIPNIVDTASFDLPKTKDSRFMLGMMGILPMQKSPHLLLEILKELRKKDNRFKISIKSKMPEEVDWLWRKPEEQSYYKQFYQSIEDFQLADSVILNPYGDDVGEWFRDIGFIISTSEHEAFHLSVAEGMASGAIPIIRNWEGASDLYPKQYLFNSVEEALQIILHFSEQSTFDQCGRSVKEYCRKHFSKEVVVPDYEKIIKYEANEVDLRTTCQKLIAANKIARFDLQKANNQYTFLQDQIQALTEQQKITMNNSNDLSEKIAGLSDLNKALSRDLIKINDTIDMQKELLRLNEAQDQLCKIKEINCELQKECFSLNKDLSSQKNAEKGLIEQINQLEHKELTMKEELEEITARNKMLETEINNQVNFICSLKENMERQIRENSDLKEYFSNKIDRMQEIMNIATSSMEDQKRESHSAIISLKQELSDNQHQTEILRRENSVLKKEISEIVQSITWRVGTILVKKPVDFLFRRK